MTWKIYDLIDGSLKFMIWRLWPLHDECLIKWRGIFASDSTMISLKLARQYWGRSICMIFFLCYFGICTLFILHYFELCLVTMHYCFCNAVWSLSKAFCFVLCLGSQKLRWQHFLHQDKPDFYILTSSFNFRKCIIVHLTIHSFITW